MLAYAPMHVTLIPADFIGCGHLRVIWPGQTVASEPNMEIRLIDGIPMIRRGREVLGVEDPETDVVVLQRPLKRTTADAVAFIQNHGTAVVVEIDDWMHELHEDHPVQANWDENVNPDHLLRACQQADVVTATTPALLDAYATPGRGALIRNHLPDWAFAQHPRHLRATEPIVAWAGGAASHPADLEVTGGAVRRVVQRLGARLHVVGPADDVAERLGYARGEITLWATGILPLPPFHGALREIDVGIVPLADTPFNAAKSCVTGLNFAAAGVPFVASPTPEYQWLAERGIGLLAETPDDWEEKIARLLSDREAHRAQARKGLELAWRRFRLCLHGQGWIDAWDQAMRYRAEAMAPAGTHPKSTRPSSAASLNAAPKR
jgi:hypothetical protein